MHSSLHYFHHANDYWTEKTHNVSDTCPHDVYPMVGGGCFTDMCVCTKSDDFRTKDVDFMLIK